MAATKAHARFVKISPLKVRLVLDLIRGKDVTTAEGVPGVFIVTAVIEPP